MTESDIEVSTDVFVELSEKPLIQVLHVDDEVGFLKVARQCLEMQGLFQVETASSVEEAMKKMKKKTFDAIVSDYLMPRKDGLKFLKELRDCGNDVPFIIFTGRDRKEVAIKALNLGADQYINKGGDPETVYGELAHGICQTVKRSEAERSLRESEEKYRNLFENAKDVVILMDLKGKVTSINKAAVEYGFKKEEFIGTNILKFIPKRNWPRILKELVQLARGKTVESRIEIITPKGKKDIEYRSDPMIVDNRVVGVQSVLRDVTEREIAQEEITARKRRLEDILDAIADSVCVTDFDGNITMVNKAMVDLFGMPREKLFTVKGRDLAAEEDKAKIFKAMQDAVKTGLPQDAEVTGRLGGTKGRPFWLRFSPLKDEKGEPAGFVTVTRDITELKRMERVLRKSEEKYRTLMEETPVGILNLDIKGTVTYVNKTFEEMTGYSRREIVGKDWSRLVREMLHVSDEVLKLIAKQIRNRLMGKSARPLRVPLRCRDGSLRWVEGDSKAVKKRGIPVGLQAILRDITELVKADISLKETMRRLETLNEKLGVVGRLTRHDVRNKLSAVTGNIYLAKKKISDDREVLQCLEDSESAIRQVERIFDFARTYEKLGVEELTWVDVEKTVKEAVSLFSDLHSIKVVNDCRGLTVLADSLLRQIFYNLIDNSLKYGEKATRIRIHYEEGKDQLKLIYEDDGIGISEAEKGKIFKEGYGKGTGYGLYLIRKICEVYGWTIKETGKHTKGAQFTITMPKIGGNKKTLYKLH